VESPTVSIIVPTFNSSRSIEECLESIKTQEYPADKLEIIIIDAGSDDSTIDIVSRIGVDKVLSNPLKTGEAGKAVGIENASGEIIALIDSDNILDGSDWMRKMVAPFENPDVVFTECYALTYRPTDSIIDRYCSLLGMNDPVHLFLGNYDRFSTLTGRWTGLPLQMTDHGDYYEVVLSEEAIPTMGANGCLLRKDAVMDVDHTPYYFDIDVVYQLVCKGHNRIGMVKKGIIHLFCPNLRTFARKQRRRINDFLYYKRMGSRSYPHQKYFWGYVKFVVFCLLVFPLLTQMMLGYARKSDPAWFIHPIACWLTLLMYGWATIRSFFLTAEFDRSDWKQ